MGRNSGGNRNTSVLDPSVAKKIGATEKGYSKELAAAVLSTEGKIRNNTDESLWIFDKDGKLKGSIGGKGAEVDFTGNPLTKQMKDAVLTHNHPRSIGQKGINAIGNSFSIQDIYSAISKDAAEIRAVTPTYTFSLKRPKTGWGKVSKTKLLSDYTRVRDGIDSEMRSYIWKQGGSQASIDRANATVYHKINRALAKEYGWDYSKKNK